VLTAAPAAGCGSSNPSGPGGGPLADRIAGLWTLAAQRPSGEQESAPPAGATFAFQIADGHAAVTADCNRCCGAAAVGDDTVALGPLLACTRAYCLRSAPFDSLFVELLAAESAASIDGHTLTLRSDRGILRFRR
jgi:heat shock protein HslJ